jgi:hypothetical protein
MLAHATKVSFFPFSSHFPLLPSSIYYIMYVTTCVYRPRRITFSSTLPLRAHTLNSLYFHSSVTNAPVTIIFLVFFTLSYMYARYTTRCMVTFKSRLHSLFLTHTLIHNVNPYTCTSMYLNYIQDNSPSVSISICSFNN